MKQYLILRHLVVDETGTGASDPVLLGRGNNPGNDEFVVQIDIATGTGTVAVQGKLHEDASWETIQEITEIDGQIHVYARVPYVRFNVTANVGSTINCWIAH